VTRCFFFCFFMPSPPPLPSPLFPPLFLFFPPPFFYPSLCYIFTPPILLHYHRSATLSLVSPSPSYTLVQTPTHSPSIPPSPLPIQTPFFLPPSSLSLSLCPPPLLLLPSLIHLPPPSPLQFPPTPHTPQLPPTSTPPAPLPSPTTPSPLLNPPSPYTHSPTPHPPTSRPFSYPHNPAPSSLSPAPVKIELPTVLPLFSPLFFSFFFSFPVFFLLFFFSGSKGLDRLTQRTKSRECTSTSHAKSHCPAAEMAESIQRGRSGLARSRVAAARCWAVLQPSDAGIADHIKDRICSADQGFDRRPWSPHHFDKRTGSWLNSA